MKRIILSILAVAALASCSKTESAYVDQDQEIRLAPVTSMTTKANDYDPVYGAIDGTTYPTTENFGVVAYWRNEVAGEKFDDGATTYLGADGAVEFTYKGLYWGGTTTYYWPKNGSLRFAAYSPYRIGKEKVTHTLKGDTYEIAFEQSTEAASTIDLLVAPTSESYTAETAAEKVSVVFEHTQSWITLKVKATEAADEVFTLRNLTINGLHKAGKLVADMIDGTKKWDYTDEAENTFVVFNGSQDVTTAVATAENDKEQNGTLVLPQATTSVTVTFDQKAEGSIPALTDQVLEIPLVLDTEHTPWEPGKHYIYTLIFDRDEILINPSVADWEDVEVNDIPATNVVAYTEAELIAAVNNGGQVRLGANIELNNTLNVDEDINVDFAGYTVTMKADAYAFRVTNGATLTLGRGAVVTTGTDAGYVARVDGENSKIIVNSGNYSTNGDCTLFYATDKGTVEVYGGYFETDTKDEWKQYMLNLKDNTGAKITVYGGTFVNWNPADNAAEGEGTNFVAAGYNVTSVVNADNETEYTVSAAEGNVTLSAKTNTYSTLNLADKAVLMVVITQLLYQKAQTFI